MNLIKDILVVIPARGGSKGVPGKNIKPLAGKPLIHYSIESARKIFSDDSICISTDSLQIKQIVEETGLTVPFLRPAEMATDTTGTYEVLLHVIENYKSSNRQYKYLLLLQPTSPFRSVFDIQQMIELLQRDNEAEMIVSVGISHHNPYFSLFEENNNGYLVKCKEGNFYRRQDCPPAFYYNGSVYLMRIDSLTHKPISQFSKVKKYVMEEKYCIDIDTPLDWLICETLLDKGIYSDENN